MPAGLKFHDGQTKWILKRALQGLLPDRILNRKKKGFGVPVGKWFLDGSLLQMSSQRMTRARYRPRYFECKLREHQAREADHRLYLWNAWLLNEWLAR
jgi:asparagine synthase (glutamine-hydrolysing)